MDLHGNPQADHGRFQQILNQFLLKSLHIILDSRILSIRPLGSRGELKKTNKWFSLALGGCPATLDNLSFWHKNLMEPMIIDIILAQEKPFSSSQNSSRPTSGLGTLTETVVERWNVQYEYSRTISPKYSDSSYKKIYKKSIILLRSLYSMMRLLPSYKAFRKLSSSIHAHDFDINYKVSAYCVPFSRAEDELMKRYTFTPVDAQQGRFSISVTYRENLSDFNLEGLTSFPPEIITGYVGSPLTDPLRAFPSSLEKGFPGSSLLSRGSQSPSPATFQRPHSWTSGLHRGLSDPQGQTLAGSPSLSRATYEFSSVPSDMHGQKLPDYRSLDHHKATYFDDYQLSPPFSPSPPNPVQTRSRPETAPVSIPHPIVGSDPNRNSLPPLSPRFVKYSSQQSPSGTRSLRRPDSFKSGESSYGMTNTGQKVSRDTKDDSGRFSGLLSSSDSPRVGFSRIDYLFRMTWMRVTFLVRLLLMMLILLIPQPNHNLDATGGSVACSQPFSTARRSQDAAVGALVHMLRTAPPLRLDSSGYASRSEKFGIDSDVGAASGFFLPRKTSDALEELKAYKEMKELLLSKSVTREVDKEEAASG